MSKERVTIGRTVHYVAPAGAHCAALAIGIVDEHTVNLAVFYDGPAYGAGPHQVPSVPYSDEPQPHTWHWPEKA